MEKTQGFQRKFTHFCKLVHEEPSLSNSQKQKIINTWYKSEKLLYDIDHPNGKYAKKRAKYERKMRILLTKIEEDIEREENEVCFLKKLFENFIQFIASLFIRNQ